MVVIVDTQEISSIKKPLNIKEETMESSTLNDESRPAKEMSGHTNCNNNGRVSEDSESVSQYTERAIAQFHQGSQLECTTVPDVSPSDVQDGPTIGEGGFAIVTAVEYEGRPCAKKALRQDIIRGTPQTYHIAAADLWKEAAFLSALKHPNIISLRAKHLSLEKMEENFIVIERLEQTLQQKITSWREKDQQVRKSPKMRLQLLQERLRICKDICETFRFLHEHHIIYRDLKADNLGFDHEGKVQLFDFGLAKELKDDAKSRGGKYKLSGNTGSLAYMAPEVAKGWQYDKMVDVYSFGILLWEIASLQPAFPNHQTRDEMHQVWSGDERPPMASWWPVELQWLMKKCWSYFANSRPDFNVISETLDELLDDGIQEEEEARGIKSFRFGSRRSQKISHGSDSSNNGARRVVTLRPRDLPEELPKKKFFGLF